MNTSPEVLFAVAERLGWTLLHSLWQGGLVAAALAVILRVIPPAGAALRHAACLLAMFVVTAAALMTAWQLPAVRISGAAASAPALSKIEANRAVDSVAPVAEPVLETAAFRDDAPAMSTAESSSFRPGAWGDPSILLVPWLTAPWVVGVALLSLRQFTGWARVRRLRQSAQPARQEWQEPFLRLAARFRVRARLLESFDAVTPMLAGVLRPVVLLPVRVATGLTPQEIEAILAHELAHLARRDSWSNFAQIIVETLFFYHPAVWWIGRCARRERECAADDLALRHGADRRSYAGALARLAEFQLAPETALAATGSDLLARIRRIVRPAEIEPAASGWSLGVPTAVALAIVAFVNARAEEPKVITVPAGASIQAAIDAAPPGAVIRLGEGEWRERIVVVKPLTLEGSGWEKSRITIEEPPESEIRAAVAALESRRKEATTPEEKKKVAAEWVQQVARPAVWVRGTGGVVLQKLRVQGLSTRGPENGLTSSVLVYLSGAKAELRDCAVVGPFGNGVQIADGSDLEIQRCLVAAIWNIGVAVSAGESGGSRLHLNESEVRNCYHRGVTIGRGCDRSVVEKCRISGSAWHGVRYDHVSPTITGNLIFANARSGIYASGATKATVKGNVFWKNEMDGISCWLGNEDTIEGNTFVGNLREGVMVIGARPTLARNIFVDHPVAIVCSVTSDRAGGASAVGDPVLRGNLFWDNKIVLQVRDEQKPAPEGSLAVDPQFREPTRQDFTLAAGSAARAASIGAAEALLPASSWPVLPDEKAITPLEDTRDSRSWGTPGAPKISKTAEEATRKAHDDSRTWVADAFQLDDAAKREAAVERVRKAMTSGNSEEARTSLAAFVQLAPIEFDKASFRPAVRHLLASPDVATRAGALKAFSLTGAEPQDLQRIYALADDSAAEVREPLTGVIMRLMNRDLTDQAASAAILKLMANLPRDARDVAHALWGGKFSPEIETRVLELCRDVPHAGGVGYEFFYGALSTQANKSAASCQRLIELLAHPDTTNIAGRAAWGLHQGVAPEQYSTVADAMVKVIQARSESYVRSGALKCLGAYGSAAHVPAVKALLAKPGVTGDFRDALEQTLKQIESRGG